MPKKIVAGNWKMNTNIAEGIALALGLKELLKKSEVEYIICPPFISLEAISKMLADSCIKIAAQNMYFEEKGSFTGEVSVTMLPGLVQYVIIGHSERRQLFGESDEMINKKVKACLEHDLIPILCVGETLETREKGEAQEFVSEQLQKDLEGLDKAKVVLAYEPIWAIGTGQTASPEQAEEMCSFIRAQGLTGNSILYGGSVNAENASNLAAMPNIDGFLVGGASLKAKEFGKICAAMQN
ncbi:MAG: triose-phosphate isomerase [Candidatus Gracilibacteria bacterium]|nr:triose-phosphate isomerase [Candidatus Gracilibacteria bacterium]